MAMLDLSLASAVQVSPHRPAPLSERRPLLFYSMAIAVGFLIGCLMLEAVLSFNQGQLFNPFTDWLYAAIMIFCSLWIAVIVAANAPLIEDK